MRFDDLARKASDAVHQQVDGHPLPGMHRRRSPLQRLVFALGAAVVLAAAVLGVAGLLQGDTVDPIDEPSTTSTLAGENTTTTDTPSTVTSTTTTVTAPPVGEGGEWFQVPHHPDVFTPARMLAVTRHGTYLVAVGAEADPQTSAGRPVSWTSIDGVNWQRSTIEVDNARFLDVASGNDLLVAVGSINNAPAIWTSPDGSNWTPISGLDGGSTIQPNTSIRAVVPYQDGFVAVGQEILIEATVPPENGYEYDDFGRAAVWLSPDGFSWTRLDDPSFGGAGYTEMADIGTNGSTLVVVGRTILSETRFVPRAWYSEDGRSWQEAPIDDDSEMAGMTTVTTDGVLFYAAGTDRSSGPDLGAKWISDGRSWERDGTIDAEVPVAGEVGAVSYLITPRGKLIIGGFKGSIWFVEPPENYPFFPAVWRESAMYPSVTDPALGSAVWVGDRVVVVGSYYSSTDEAVRAAVWHWIPPDPLVPPTIEPPDPNGPLCAEVVEIDPESTVWDEVAGGLFDQERVARGLTEQNVVIYVEGVTQDGWVTFISWFDRTVEGMTLWVGEPVEPGWSFTPVWGRFGAPAEEILGALDQRFPAAPPGLFCIDTEPFRSQ
jgi:hypothetical protein